MEEVARRPFHPQAAAVEGEAVRRTGSAAYRAGRDDSGASNSVAGGCT